MESMKGHRQSEHDQGRDQVIPERYNGWVRDSQWGVHVHIRDIVKEASKGNKGYNLKLLADEFGHRFRQYYNQKKNLVGENEAEWGIDRFEVVERLPPIHGGDIVQQKYQSQMGDKEENCQPYDEDLKGPNVLWSDMACKHSSE
jgi:hypothetical protein